MAKAILQNSMSPADYARTIWHLVPEPGTTLECIQAPEYYAHVAKTLRAGDRVSVAPADGAWLAELYVRATDDNSARVALLSFHDFNPATPVEGTPTLDIKHRGPRGWSVVRRSDKAVLFEGGKTREDAEVWATEQSLD